MSHLDCILSRLNAVTNLFSHQIFYHNEDGTEHHSGQLCSYGGSGVSARNVTLSDLTSNTEEYLVYTIYNYSK